MARKAPPKLRTRFGPIAAAVGLGMAAFAAVAMGLDLKLISALREGSAARAEAPVPDAGADKSAGARPVYPYSIIPGGAETVEELQNAISADPVVAAHFTHFDLSKTRVETLKEPKVAHVSYRKGQDVFWTRKPVQLPAGERVLTDGTNVARVRCGNCLSDRPGAVSSAEPDPDVLDTPQGPSDAGGPPSTGIGGWSDTAPPGSGVGGPGPSSTPTGGAPGPGNSPPGSGGPSGGPSGGHGPDGQTVDGGAPVGGVTAGGATSVGGMGGPFDNGAPGETTGPDGADNSGNGPGNPGNSGNTSGTGGSTGPGNPSTGPANPGGPGNPAGSGAGTPSSGPGNPPGNAGLPSSGGGPNPPSQSPGPTFSPDGGLPPLWLPPGGFQPPGGTGITPPGFDSPPATTLPPAGGANPPGSGGGPGDNPDEGEDPQSVPEPGTTALMLLGGAWMLRKRVFTSRSSRRSTDTRADL